jgi:(p)ppGpp synthase/HD superfamily hydrolase
MTDDVAVHEWTPRPEMLGEQFDEALELAAQAHRQQRRKGSSVPYIGHLLGVCAMVIEEGGGETEAIAALLHDIVEDQGGSERLAEVRSRFGEAVATIVEACSDRIDRENELPWRERKATYLAHLDSQPTEVLIVSLADKLYNARAIQRDYRQSGAKLWERFNAERGETLWYYRELSHRFARLMPDCRMTRELATVVADLEREVAADEIARGDA